MERQCELPQQGLVRRLVYAGLCVCAFSIWYIFFFLAKTMPTLATAHTRARTHRVDMQRQHEAHVEEEGVAGVLLQRGECTDDEEPSKHLLASACTRHAPVCLFNFDFYLLVLNGEGDAHDLTVRRGHRYEPPAELPARDNVVRDAVKHVLGEEAVGRSIDGDKPTCHGGPEVKIDSIGPPPCIEHTYPSGAWQRIVGPSVLSNSLYTIPSSPPPILRPPRPPPPPAPCSDSDGDGVGDGFMAPRTSIGSWLA